MNTDQEQIFNNLELLITENDAFFRQEFILDEKIYWIYNYRLASYTDFLAPSAIEARGIMFEVTNEGKFIRLASRPMQKFWNLNENPNTMDIDLNMIESISNKADGSLISTYIHNNELRLKSKGSLFSDQAIDAMKWLELDENQELKSTLDALTWVDYTVNFEWCSPNNRIVLGYMEPRLIVLNIRDNKSGNYTTINSDNELFQYMDPPVDTKGLSLIDFVNQIPTMQDDIEGFVVKMNDGLWMKIKTQKYLALHHCKDSVNNPRRLFEVIVNEGIDDIRSMFHTDELLIKQIDDMQVFVDNIFNTMVKTVEEFYDANKTLERKDFAIKAQLEVPKLYFGLLMMLYQDKPVDYKSFMIKSYKHFGIKDEKQEE
jgi:T4 RnlA family RNA ligase